MEGRKVPLERAVCSHCPAAGLDPNTSSCVNFLMHIIYIIVIYIPIYYLIIHFQVCFGQDFTLLNPAVMDRGLSAPAQTHHFALQAACAPQSGDKGRRE